MSLQQWRPTVTYPPECTRGSPSRLRTSTFTGVRSLGTAGLLRSTSVTNRRSCAADTRTCSLPPFTEQPCVSIRFSNHARLWVAIWQLAIDNYQLRLGCVGHGSRPLDHRRQSAIADHMNQDTGMAEHNRVPRFPRGLPLKRMNTEERSPLNRLAILPVLSPTPPSAAFAASPTVDSMDVWSVKVSWPDLRSVPSCETRACGLFPVFSAEPPNDTESFLSPITN